jgi:hypothetical protein
MAFGQASGPPAPAKLVAQLEAQLNQHGFASFKEARHPFGLTQRQAAGKFTSAEANELIERLVAQDEVRAAEPERARTAPDRPAPTGRGARPRATAPPSPRDLAKEEELVTGLTADVMATELTNRGWCCIPPE